MRNPKTKEQFCCVCNKDSDELWTFGGFYERYIAPDSWFCIICFNKKKEEIENIVGE